MNEALNVEVADRIVETLNRAHGQDPHAIAELIEQRVWCNRNLAEDPTIQVGVDNETGRYRVGLLGILNGVAGQIQTGRLRGFGYVAAVYQVVCPCDERHRIGAQVAGDACPVCDAELKCGKLLRFETIELGDGDGSEEDG
jgi:hypothetical protein